jgi:hypothetical protein
MATPLDLRSIIASVAAPRRLAPRNDLAEPGWRFWELRTLNMHRVVGLLEEHREFRDAHDLETAIRGVVARHFKRSWWRGLAYGIVAETTTMSSSADDLKQLVDVRENPKGTLQWVILVSSHARVALGVHTWIEGYLSPVYRGALQALAARTYRIASVKKDKDGLMKVLTAVADFDVALRSLGTRRQAFPEFRDER